MKGSEPSVPRQTGIFSFLSVCLRPAGAHRDINGWYRASFWGSIACIVLYTAFGYVFVRAHALRITAEMGLLARFGMTALINPDDVHLIGAGPSACQCAFFRNDPWSPECPCVHGAHLSGVDIRPFCPPGSRCLCRGSPCMYIFHLQ